MKQCSQVQALINMLKDDKGGKEKDGKRNYCLGNSVSCSNLLGDITEKNFFIQLLLFKKILGLLKFCTIKCVPVFRYKFLTKKNKKMWGKT